jgi:hypothetical protein
MKRRDAIVEELHKLREQIGRAHDFDVDRIAMTIRQHEREAGRPPAAAVTPARSTRRPKIRGRRAAQQRDEAVDA